ncbi:MAG: ABC transporter permease [Pirellulaceae bacterium]|nr:ABC transporter permease [Pirellulaceae bacterium]
MTASQSQPQPASNPTAAESDEQRYERLLAEASTIRGVSLWQDAWRRLRRNWMAIGSLALLIAMALTVLLTPALPLQSPILTDLDHRQFEPPNTRPARLDLRQRLAEFESDVRPLREQLRTASGAELTELRKQLSARYAVEHPFQKLWHKPDWLSRQLLTLRVALFGDWCIPSLCGTDQLGRDMLARICWGGRVSLVVGIVATLVSLVIGVSYGATAGYLGGLADSLMMRIVDVLYSVPFIFVVIFLITILGQGDIKAWLDRHGINQITIFYFVIGAIYWLTMSRVVRGQVISLKNEQFVEAARTIGASSRRIIFRHLIPNVMGVVIVYLTLTIPAVMMFEAFLSFLGLGVSPPDVSWGLLVNDGIQVITRVRIYWWLVLFPGLTLALTLFALNFLGDGLRDALDPKMKNR